MEQDRNVIDGGADATAVKNKDIPLLASIWYIMQDICGLERRREWQRERMLNITQHLSGMPGGGGSPKGLDDTFSLLSELDFEHEQKCKEYLRQLKKAEKIVNSIESRAMRTFVEMKYIMDIPDTKIRKELNMSRRGFDRAKNCVENATSMSEVKWRDRYILAAEE